MAMPEERGRETRDVVAHPVTRINNPKMKQEAIRFISYFNA